MFSKFGYGDIFVYMLRRLQSVSLGLDLRYIRLVMVVVVIVVVLASVIVDVAVFDVVVVAWFWDASLHLMR